MGEGAMHERRSAEPEALEQHERNGA